MHELVLRVPEAEVEIVGDLLAEGPDERLQALSVSVQDADAGTEAERALFGEPGMPAPQPGWLCNDVTALYEDEARATEACAWILAQRPDAGLVVRALRPVEDQDWVRLTQSQFEPIEVTPTFWIVPSWHETPAAARRVIRLDPGLAFGTGSHPTTRMCLRWIATRADAGAPWARVLDYGCGSGILAIAAALHGAREVVGVDLDDAAVQSTHDNAAANDVGVSAGPTGHEGAPAGAFDVVLANILATPLKLLAPLLCSHLRPDGGRLVLAGILARQADELKAAYAPWVRLDVTDEEDGWILMTATADTSTLAP